MFAAGASRNLINISVMKGRKARVGESRSGRDDRGLGNRAASSQEVEELAHAKGQPA
jgi:hypothetical protein